VGATAAATAAAGAESCAGPAQAAGHCEGRAGQLRRWGRLHAALTTRFKLATALGNAGQCGEARRLVAEALALLEPQLRALDAALAALGQAHTGSGAAASEAAARAAAAAEVRELRRLRSGLGESHAYLLVAASRCAPNLAACVALAERALAAAEGQSGPAPGHGAQAFALGHATLVRALEAEAAAASGAAPEDVLMGWEEDPKSQISRRTFHLRQTSGPFEQHF
jgi:hypothetical protein